MALPFPSFPYASAGGTVSFLRSPVHILCRPLSQPFTASWIPRVNQTGFWSPSLRLQVGVTINASQLHSEDWKRQLHPHIWRVHITWNEIACHYSLGIHRNVQGACLHILTYENKRVVYVELQSLPPAQAIFFQWHIQRLTIIAYKQTKESFWFVCKKKKKNLSGSIYYLK